MYTAIEAREKAINSISDQTKKQLSTVDKYIKRAAESGETKCWIDNHLEKQAIGKLKELGYGVENHSNQKDGSCFLITW